MHGLDSGAVEMNELLDKKVVAFRAYRYRLLANVKRNFLARFETEGCEQATRNITERTQAMKQKEVARIRLDSREEAREHIGWKGVEERSAAYFHRRRVVESIINERDGRCSARS